MIIETYQLATMAAIGIAGLGYSTYLGNARRKAVDNFCNNTAPKLIAEAQRINDDLNGRFNKLFSQLEVKV